MKFMTFFLVPMLLPFYLYANEGQDQSQIVYNIQLGAYQRYVEDNFVRLEQYGSVHTENIERGLTRVRIGHYESPSDARKALRQIQASGFQDAFIVTTVTDSAELTADFAAQTQSRPETMPIWQELSDEQRRNVVYLDGVLYMKEGNDFISLSEYTP